MAQTCPGRDTAEAGGSGLPDSVSSAIRKTAGRPNPAPTRPTLSSWAGPLPQTHSPRAGQTRNSASPQPAPSRHR